MMSSRSWPDKLAQKDGGVIGAIILSRVVTLRPGRGWEEGFFVGRCGGFLYPSLVNLPLPTVPLL